MKAVVATENVRLNEYKLKFVSVSLHSQPTLSEVSNNLRLNVVKMQRCGLPANAA